MIVLRVKGGLGNQLFQYASARGIAVSTGDSLRLDHQTGFLHDSYGRSYRLNHFRIDQPFASMAEIWRSRAVSYRRWRRLRNEEWAAMLDREDFFFPELGRHTKEQTVYLEAYLQSPRYFACIGSQLRAELSPSSESEALRTRRRHIQGCNAISVHIRRLDYSRVLPVSYYLQAAAIIEQRVSRPEYFVFGDDLEWAAQELSWLKPKTFVRSEPPEDDVTDLALMATCRHHIMANSTFSWWGSWLTEHGDAVVIAPGQGWTRNSAPPKNLFLPEWVVI